MKKIQFLIIVLFSFFLTNTSIFAQYHGGDSDGSAIENLSIAACPIPAHFFAYFGGDFDSANVETIVNSVCTTPASFFPYMGGEADNAVVETINNTICGFPPSFFPYMGGDNDTASVETISNTLCGIPFSFYPYFGGDGDGYSIGKTNPVCPTLPPVSSFTASSTSVCVGQTVTFTDTSTNIPSNWSWVFVSGTPAVSTSENQDVIYNTPGTYAVSLTASNYNGTDTLLESGYITVTATPTVASTTPAARCNAGTVTLGATASAGTLSWYAAATGGTALATGASFTTPSITATTTYYVEASNNSCTSARTAVIATVNATPTVASTTPATRCGTGTVTLGATASAGTLSWYAAATGGTALATGASFTTPSITATTTYYVEASNSSCTSARTAVFATVNVVMPPTAASTQTFCNSETVGMLVVSGTAINWYSAATGGSLLSNNTLLVAGSTYYSSQTVFGCESTTRLAVTVSLGSCLNSNQFKLPGLVLYPNPVNDFVNIEYSENITRIEIFNILGQKLNQNWINNQKASLDMTVYPSGNYLLKVYSEAGSEIFKLVKR